MKFKNIKIKVYIKFTKAQGFSQYHLNVDERL